MEYDAHYHDESRLGRIENKIDQLSDAMVIIARTEERMNNYDRNFTQHIERFRFIEDKSELAIRRLHERLDQIEKVVNHNHDTVRSVQKMFWIIITAIITTAGGAIVNYFF